MLRFLPKEPGCFVVMDLEWNQRYGNKTNHDIPHEIIEIGAVKLDLQLNILDERRWLVKPTVYQTLDKHIQKVTGIEAYELQQGKHFPESFQEFLIWCGDDAALCTWGRDDYPVMLRNCRYFCITLPFAPPIDLQMVYAHLLTDKPSQQVGLSAAMESLELPMDLPAHRALNDAIYTTRIMAALDTALQTADPARIEALRDTLQKEAIVARSITRSMQTPHFTPEEVLADEVCTAVSCPICDGETRVRVPWFDGGHGRFLGLFICPHHGTALGQMHFKRYYNERLILHQRIYLAPEDEIAETEKKAQLLPKPKKKSRRRHRSRAKAKTET